MATSASSSTSANTTAASTATSDDPSLLRVGGVPEHFNAPWHSGLQENGAFARHNVKIHWTDIPEGSGRMCNMLRDGSLDVAVILTEGIVRDIPAGCPARLVATFVASKLTWAVNAAPHTSDRLRTVDDLCGGTIGISRYGSGSHLMSVVLAQTKKWTAAERPSFAVFNNFAGLREAVRSGACDAFMWETFMSKPYRDKGELRKIGEVVTPWPCFVIAVHERVLATRWELVTEMLAALQEAVAEFKQGGEASVRYVHERHSLTMGDARQWFEGVQYATNGALSRAALVKTIDTLVSAGMLPKLTPVFSYEAYYDARATLSEVDPDEIATLHLFYESRMRNYLQELGLSDPSKPLDPNVLMKYDQLHYYGPEAVDHAASVLHFKPDCRVLDVGSGLGGPARYMASKYGCNVTAVELKPDRAALALELTRRCGLQHSVRHLAGDMTTLPLDSRDSRLFDHVVSWLSILHVEARKRVALFANLCRWLHPGGTIIVEDFVQLGPFTPRERSDLAIGVGCTYVPTMERYKLELEQGGFSDVVVEDISASWRQFVANRLQRFEAEREELIRVHGEEVVTGVGYFYSLINNLFVGGHLGGARFIGRYKFIVEPA